MNNETKKPDQAEIDRLIQQYASGEIDRHQMQVMEDWVKENNDHLKYYWQFRMMLDASRPLSVQTGTALENVLSRIERKNKGRKILFNLERIAAILFIPVVISILLYLFIQQERIGNAEIQYKTITAAFGSVCSFILADGSKVWLNTGSSLQVPERFPHNRRLVKLSGEAYFEVKSDHSSSFIVETDHFSVEATGTRFNVMSYTDQTPSVTLAEGSVTVHTLFENNDPERILMWPGQHLVIDVIKKGTVLEQGDTYKYYAWKDGKLVFRNDLMASIMQRISLQYNVDIEIADQSILQYRYRATFENESLTEVLNLLKLASPIDYYEIDPVMLPDSSSYSRRKIIITERK
jgi:ferric-dicitrate binding protein FerR (iron transport regulator)